MMFAAREWINPIEEYWIVKFADLFRVDEETLAKYLYPSAQLKGEPGVDN